MNFGTVSSASKIDENALFAVFLSGKNKNSHEEKIAEAFGVECALEPDRSKEGFISFLTLPGRTQPNIVIGMGDSEGLEAWRAGRLPGSRICQCSSFYLACHTGRGFPGSRRMGSDWGEPDP